MRNWTTVFAAIVGIAIFVSLSPLSVAVVTGYELTIDRIDFDQTIFHCFCADLWGTDIAGVVITAPTNAQYNMVFSSEEDQWLYDEEGSESFINDKFPDGTYQFDVTYNDNTTETLFRTLNRNFPPYPVIAGFNKNRISWEPWSGGSNGVAIEVFVESSIGTDFECEVLPGATSCAFPPGFIDEFSIYSVEMLFLASAGVGTFSNSGIARYCPAFDADSDGVPDDGDCSGVVGDNLCADGDSETCDDNCRLFSNPTQNDQRAWLTYEFKNPQQVLPWQPLGLVTSLSGQELEVVWIDNILGDGHMEYRYRGPDPSGTFGACIFEHGINIGEYEGAPPLVEQGDNLAPDYFTKLVWWNIDGGTDDPETDTGLPNGKVDRYMYYYDICENHYLIRQTQAPYPAHCKDGQQDAISVAPNLFSYLPGCAPEDLTWTALPDQIIPLGSAAASDAIDQLVSVVEQLPLAERPMAAWAFAACDVDTDGDCDSADRALVANLNGTCLGDPGFNPHADFDASRCIDATDEAILFDQDTDDDGVGDFADNCLNSANPTQADSDADSVGTVCDCDDTAADTFPGALEQNDGRDNQCPGELGFGEIDEIAGIATFQDPSGDTILAWTAQTGATSYTVARAESPEFATSCATFATSSAQWTETSTPLPGALFYYLARPSQPFPGSWGRSSSGAERDVPCS